MSWFDYFTGPDRKNEFISDVLEKAQEEEKKILLPESTDQRVLEAAEFLHKNGIVDVYLLGDEKEILKKGTEFNVSLHNVNIIGFDRKDELAEAMGDVNRFKDANKEERRSYLDDPMAYAMMLVKEGVVDGVVGGAVSTTEETFVPALHLLNPEDNYVSTYFIMAMTDRLLLFADSALNIDPDKEELAKIAENTGYAAKKLGVNPRIAMLSFSTKGSAEHAMVDKVRGATEIVKEETEFVVAGEVQVDTALVPEVQRRKAPDSAVKGDANILIFPDLNAGNIGYKLVERLAGSDAFGPITYGLSKPVNDLSRGCSVEDIVDVCAITAVQAQGFEL